MRIFHHTPGNAGGLTGAGEQGGDKNPHHLVSRLPAGPEAGGKILGIDLGRSGQGLRPAEPGIEVPVCKIYAVPEGLRSKVDGERSHLHPQFHLAGLGQIAGAVSDDAYHISSPRSLKVGVPGATPRTFPEKRR